MTFRRIAARLGLALALCIPAAALAAPLIAFDSAVFIERIKPGQGRLLQPAATFKRGDRVIYVVSWMRKSGTGAFIVNNAVPRTVYYQGSADGSEEVSIDGGKRWGKLEQLRVGTRIATPEDVTHLRWHLSAGDAARGSGEITYSAIVR
ncbi:hypothetical protein [Novosphingobium sp.]|uniref:hypothetical protein n=1 Tax=Novosphingobium sp. TaxID=1874826 RepID=UPI00286D074B|nr:hypothetical protein [Novosphingobium sp.]